jgi:integrase
MKNAPKMRQSNKGDLRYWRARIFLPPGAISYQVEIQRRGERHKVSLETPNKEAAADKARKLYQAVTANGWEAALQQHRPTMAEKKSDLTIGEYLNVLRRTADARTQTIEGYAVAFRKIVADMEGIADNPSKYAPSGAGRAEWLQSVHAVKLARITPERVQQWKREFLDRCDGDELKLRTARTSVNSFLRRAKSLFSKKLTKHLGSITLPSPLPFDQVTFEKRQSMRYRSGFDVLALLQTAREELATTEPDVFKAFLLATTCGLRRGEIDTLEWSAFRWDAGLLRIEATQHFHPKSEYSLGDIDLEPEIMAIFRGYHAKGGGCGSGFVIELPKRTRIYTKRRRSRPINTYRCQMHFERLAQWLQNHGVTDRKPLHALRKEYGSQVCDRHGIYAASRALRHASVTITAAHYLDKKSKVTSGLGASFSDKVTPISEVEAA